MWPKDHPAATQRHTNNQPTCSATSSRPKAPLRRASSAGPRGPVNQQHKDRRESAMARQAWLSWG
eukprot:15464424-Alexandrium_andersonii.AAC.1